MAGRFRALVLVVAALYAPRGACKIAAQPARPARQRSAAVLPHTHPKSYASALGQASWAIAKRAVAWSRLATRRYTIFSLDLTRRCTTWSWLATRRYASFSLNLTKRCTTYSLNATRTAASRSFNLTKRCTTYSLDATRTAASRSFNLTKRCTTYSLDATRTAASRSFNLTKRCTTYSLDATRTAASRSLNLTKRCARGLLAPFRLLKGWRGGGGLDGERRALLEDLRAEVLARRKLVRDARRGRMPLDDATLTRYLAAARWKPRFPDRSVADAVADTAQWRASCAAARAPEKLPPPDPELKRMFWSGPRGVRTRRGEAVLLFHCRHCRPATLSHLVRVIEGGCRGGNGRCALVLDCRGAPATALFDTLGVIKPALSVFQKHYCGRLGRVVVLKSGSAGQTLWWIARKFCDAATRDKIAFVEDAARLEPVVRVADLNRDPEFGAASKAERGAAPRRHTLYL